MNIKRIKSNWWQKGFFEEGMSNVLYGTSGIAPAYDEVSWILKMSGMPKKGKVLDVGCGVGRHSVAFAKNGFDVLGIDISGNFLERARQLAAKEKVVAKFKRMPMHELTAKNEYDILVNLFTSFGYYSPRTRNVTIFKKMAGSLRPGGYMVFDATYLEAMDRNFQPKNWRMLGDDKFLLEKRLYSRMDKLIYNDWYYVDGKKRKHYRFKVHLFSRGDLKKMFTDNGLKIVGCYGSLTGEVFGSKSPHLVIVARKMPRQC